MSANMPAKYDSKALTRTFLAAFPLGRLLKPEEFDEWGRRHGLLNTPPDIPKQSDAWMAHLQRRHQLRYNINREAVKPRRGENDHDPFTIDAVSGGLWEVRTPATAISKNTMARRVGTLVVTKRRHLQKLMASADWSVLPPYERLFAESLYDNIEQFAKRTLDDSDWLSHKFALLQSKLKHAEATGELKPINGGLRAMTAPEDDDDSDADGVME